MNNLPKEQSIQAKISQQAKKVNAQVEVLQQERATLKELKEQKARMIFEFWEELKEISFKYMAAILDKKDGGYPGLKDFLKTIVIKINEFDYNRKIDGYSFQNAMLYYDAFSPVREESYRGVQNKLQRPSVIFVDDPRFLSSQNNIIQGGMQILADNLGVRKTKEMFLPIYLFFVVKKKTDYMDAFMNTKAIFEDKKLEKLSAMDKEKEIIETLYDML